MSTEDGISVTFINSRPFLVTFSTNGAPGESAYEIAVRNGFVGTEQEWLDSLRSDIFKNPTPPPTPYLYQLWLPTP